MFSKLWGAYTLWTFKRTEWAAMLQHAKLMSFHTLSKHFPDIISTLGTQISNLRPAWKQLGRYAEIQTQNKQSSWSAWLVCFTIHSHASFNDQESSIQFIESLAVTSLEPLAVYLLFLWNGVAETSSSATQQSSATQSAAGRLPIKWFRWSHSNTHFGSSRKDLGLKTEDWKLKTQRAKTKDNRKMLKTED